MKLGLALALLGLPAVLAGMLPRHADTKTTHFPHKASSSSSPKTSIHSKTTTPTKTSIHTKTSSHTSQSGDGKPIPTSSSPASAANSGMTEIAVFTAGGVAHTVTSFHSSELIDGKTLSRGGPTQTIAGDRIQEATNGNVVVDGTTIKFHPYAASSSSSAPNTVSSNSASKSSGSSNSSSSSSTSSAPVASGTSNGAAPGGPPKAVAGGAAIFGAVVGALVL